MEKEVIQVEIPAGKKAAWVDGFLKLVDAEEEQKKDERPITERVKTFEDACKELGEDHKLVQQFKAIQEAIAEDKEATAYFKLGIITAALNEGWEPDFTNDDEYRYYFGLAITSSEFLDFVQTNAGGSAQPQANPPLLGEFELSIPNKQSLPEFNTKISSFLGVIESNETEISKLHEVKDTMVKMLSSR